MQYIEENYEYCQKLSGLNRDQVINKIDEYIKRTGTPYIYATDHAQELYCQIFEHKFSVTLFGDLTEDIRKYNKEIDNRDQFYLGLQCNLCKYHKQLVARDIN